MNKISAIWKYQLVVAQTQVLMLPMGAKILDAQMQHDQLCIWAQIDMQHKNFLERRTFEIFATGQEIVGRGHMQHITTFQPKSGLVFHLFEVSKNDD